MVLSGNQPPTLNALSDLTINEDAGLQTVNLSGISSGSANESQTLTVTASSSNTGLIPTPTVSYTSPSTKGSISFTPVAEASGTATITVTVDDGGASNNVVSRSLTVTVNQAPRISPIPDTVIAVDTSTPPLHFTISDTETSVTNLTVAAVSTNPDLVPDSNIALAGTGTHRTVTVTPRSGTAGIADITISVSDGFATTSVTFKLSVQVRPTPPDNFRVAGSGVGQLRIGGTPLKLPVSSLSSR